MLLRRHRKQNNENKENEIKENDFSELKVNELKELAKEKEIKGYANMKKEELIEALTALKVVDDNDNSKSE